jgi:tRNA nucleotidyltransferase/poly(A) polymerase
MVDITGTAFTDIEEQVIKTPTNPDVTFIEDPLRMLRGIRFSSTLGFVIDKTTETSMQKNAKHLQTISYERIREELSKILMSSYPGAGIHKLTTLGLMNYIIPEIYDIIGLEQNKYHTKDVYSHTIDVVLASPPILEVRMAALLHDLGKSKVVEKNEDGTNSFHRHELYSGRMAENILRKLKYDNKFIKTVSFIVSNHMRLKQFGAEAELASDKSIRRLLTDSGDKLSLLLELCHADNLSHAPKYCLPNQIEGLLERIKNIKFEPEKIKIPITGTDIMETFNILPGKKVGDLLQLSEEYYLENPNITKEELITKLKEHIDV